MPTLPHKCFLPSGRKTSHSPGPQRLSPGLFLPSILYAVAAGGSSRWMRCQRQPPAQVGSHLLAPLIGPCHLLHTTPGADDTWMSWAPRLLILSGRRSPFPPSFCITFHCLPPLPLSLALPLGSSLPPFCLSSGPQVDKQVLSGLFP